MKTALLTTLLALAALNTAAKTGPFPLVGDPLTDHIVRERTRGNDVITGSAFDAKGQAAPFKIVDPLAASLAEAPLRDAVADPNALKALKPATGLTTKAAKKQAPKKNPRKAKAQLQKVSAEKLWPGRK